MAAARAPDREAFTSKEWKLVEQLTTPEEAQKFLSEFAYNPTSTQLSFRGVVERGTADCLEGALLAATVLEQHGIPPVLLDLDSQDGIGHVLLLYREAGRFGAVGLSQFPGLHGRKPVYKTVRQLALSYYDPYIDATGRLLSYATLNLKDVHDVDWRFGDGTIDALAQRLIHMPHQRLETSDKRYHVLRQRYLRFKQRHPRREPRYYRTVANWLE